MCYSAVLQCYGVILLAVFLPAQYSRWWGGILQTNSELHNRYTIVLTIRYADVIQWLCSMHMFSLSKVSVQFQLSYSVCLEFTEYVKQSKTSQMNLRMFPAIALQIPVRYRYCLFNPTMVQPVPWSDWTAIVQNLCLIFNHQPKILCTHLNE